MSLLHRELTLARARELIQAGRIVYPVVKDDTIVKVFDYHKQANEYIEGLNGHCMYNISHPKCPRWVKLELGYINQLDLFKDSMQE